MVKKGSVSGRSQSVVAKLRELTLAVLDSSVVVMRSFVVFIILFAFSFSLDAGSVLSGLDSHSSECHSQTFADDTLATGEVHDDGSSRHAAGRDADRDSSPASHDQDCHCPMHRSGCCHPIGFIFRPTSVSWIPIPVVQEFAELKLFAKQDPMLEGPFQPPRAA